MPDAELIARVTELATAERHTTAQLVAALSELDSRRLYLGQGCSSLFAYCTQVLHLSEHAAYGRIEAARAARRFPAVLDRLADGSLTLTAVCLLAPHLTPDNCAGVLDAARHRTKREIEVLVAALRPQPPVPSTIRKLPTPRPSSLPQETSHLPVEAADDSVGASTPMPVSPVLVKTHALEESAATPSESSPVPTCRPAVIAPLTPDQYKLQITISRETLERLRRVQDLLRHALPSGDPAVIFEKALTALLSELERTKLAVTDRPRQGGMLTPGSRHVPAAIRRAVWTRDEGRCAFVSENGRRCTERGFMEFHHSVPYAAGGEATVDSIELRCRAHNLYEGELDFGRAVRRHARAERTTSKRRASDDSRANPRATAQ
jgi:5-methylcytosine-specific restriction endonuclease McrA